MSVAMQGPDDQEKVLADRKSIQEDTPSLPVEEAARRERIASQAPQTLPSGIEKAEKVPTVVPGMTMTHYSPDSNSPLYTEPFSPLYPRESESPILVRNPQDYSSSATAQPSAGPAPESSISQAPPPMAPAPPSSSSLICGMRRRTFWLLLVAILIIIVAAAVGGGVGGAIAVQNSNNGDDGGSAAAAQSSTSSSQTSQSTSSESPKPTGSPPTKPHFDFTLRLWEGANYTGNSQLFYEPGGFKLAFIARGYDWTYGIFNDQINVCSVAFCRGGKWLGYRGSTTDGDGAAWGGKDDPGPDNVVIACGESFADPGCRVPMAIKTFTTVPTISAGPTKSTTVPSETKSTGSASTTTG